jgi:hypothetical protein
MQVISVGATLNERFFFVNDFDIAENQWSA